MPREAWWLLEKCKELHTCQEGALGIYRTTDKFEIQSAQPKGLEALIIEP